MKKFLKVIYSYVINLILTILVAIGLLILSAVAIVLSPVIAIFITEDTLGGIPVIGSSSSKENKKKYNLICIYINQK